GVARGLALPRAILFRSFRASYGTAHDAVDPLARRCSPQLLTGGSQRIQEPKGFMPHYLIQASYTAEAWKALLNKPEYRAQAVRPVIEKLGGRIVRSWYAFGPHDIVAIVEMPDNVSAAALALAETAGGALRSLQTTPLLELAEGLEAMKRASKAGYRPPGK